jgi:thiol-disulfide isomerase/thioredoxin
MRHRLGVTLSSSIALVIVAGAAHAAGVPDRAQLADALRTAHGRPRLVHLWASWCRPCLAEWPTLARWLSEVARRPVDVITVALDEETSAPAARRVLKELGRLPGRHLVVALDEAAPLLTAADPDWDGSLPTTLLLDGAGQLLVAQRGGTRYAELDAALARAAPRKTKGGRN